MENNLIWMKMLWCIHKVKEFESNSQRDGDKTIIASGCDVSTKLKNLKATHNRGAYFSIYLRVVMYPQS